jgi:3-oxoadipate enol-lactonase
MPPVTLPGLTMWLEEQGAGEPLLLLHGLGSSADDWEAVAPPLARRYHVLMPDFRGHGRSDKPPGAYGVALFAEDIAALCAALGIRRAHVVGISMGGMVALQLAVAHPALVASLTVINSTPHMVPSGWRIRLALAIRVAILALFGSAVLARMLTRRLFPKPEQVALRERVRARLAANDRDVYLRATRGLIGWTVRDRLPEIRCPVLVLASERDYTPVADKRAWAAQLPDARVEVIADSGHAAPGDQPAAVSAQLLRFLERTTS